MNLVTITEAATILKVHPNTIRNLIRDGYITPIRIGERVIRIDMNALTGSNQ